MGTWKVTFSRDGGAGRARSFSFRVFWLAAPAALAVLAFLLSSGPWNDWPPEAPGAPDVIVPLSARDPSALVMAPYWGGKSNYPVPTVERPR